MTETRLDLVLRSGSSRFESQRLKIKQEKACSMNKIFNRYPSHWQPEQKSDISAGFALDANHAILNLPLAQVSLM